MKYWLLKSEPGAYSIDDLKSDKKTAWTGVRNYQARNFIRDEMKVGDLCLFYHSNAGEDGTGVAGIAKVSSKPYRDPAADDSKSPYFEPKKSIEWVVVDITFSKKFKRIVTLQELKSDPRFKDMILVQKGSRLSVQPVSKKHFDLILAII